MQCSCRTCQRKVASNFILSNVLEPCQSKYLKFSRKTNMDVMVDKALYYLFSFQLSLHTQYLPVCSACTLYIKPQQNLMYLIVILYKNLHTAVDEWLSIWQISSMIFDNQMHYWLFFSVARFFWHSHQNKMFHIPFPFLLLLSFALMPWWDFNVWVLGVGGSILSPCHHSIMNRY